MTMHPIERIGNRIEKEISNLQSILKEYKSKIDFINARIQSLEWVENEIDNLELISKVVGGKRLQ